MEPTGVRGFKRSLNKVHQFSAIFPAVDDRQGVLRLRRDKTHLARQRLGQSVHANLQRHPDLHLPEIRSGTKNRTFMYSGGSTDKHRRSGRHPLAGPKVGVVDQASSPAPIAASGQISSQPARGRVASPLPHVAPRAGPVGRCRSLPRQSRACRAGSSLACSPSTPCPTAPGSRARFPRPRRAPRVPPRAPARKETLPSPPDHRAAREPLKLARNRRGHIHQLALAIPGEKGRLRRIPPAALKPEHRRRNRREHQNQNESPLLHFPEKGRCACRPRGRQDAIKEDRQDVIQGLTADAGATLRPSPAG